MKRALALSLLALLLTACGRQADLSYPAGSTGPATPAGASAPPTPRDLTEPTVQAQPERDDEVLRRSEERGADPFDLPPEH